jgi:spore coat polysaccharide biosynthesis protein SpsF (cytidylyltransferase family)
VTIAASASDNVGVVGVQFFVTGVLTCTDTIAPYTCAWSVPKTKGNTYDLTARAFDAANNSATSTVVRVTSR